MRNSVILSTDEVQKLQAGEVVVKRVEVKPQPDDDYGPNSIKVGVYHPCTLEGDEVVPGPEKFGAYTRDGECGWPAPYQPGQVVWVRERAIYIAYMHPFPHHKWSYFADGRLCKLYKGERYYSAATMPRSAARLHPTVTAVTVEQVEGKWMWCVSLQLKTTEQ